MFTVFQKSLERAALLLVVLTPLFPATFAFAATQPAVTVLTPAVTKDLGSPLAIAVDPSGYCFVADLRKRAILKLDPSGQLVQAITVKAPAKGVALNDRGNLLVSQGDAVVLLDQTGAQLGLLGSGKGQFKQAAGIAVDARGYVYVADSAAHNIRVFTAAGNLVKTIGSKGTGKGQFSFPMSIAYEKSSDQIAVSDLGNSRVQFFSAVGNYDFVKVIGSYGTTPLHFKSPVSVTFEYDAAGKPSRMFVADLSLNQIQVIDPAGSGTFLSYIGKSGLVNGQLMTPMDLAFDATNRRLIVVNGNGHLNLFGIDGGANPGLPQGLVIDPVPATVSTATVTISGTVPANSTVLVTSNSGASTKPVVYTSSNTWQASVNNLVPGSNVLTAAAIDQRGSTVSKQSVDIVYAAP